MDSLLKDNRATEDFPMECFVQLNYGLRSSKAIYLYGDDYYVQNEIDGSEEFIEHDKLMESFIGEAICKGAFYKW
ncbi:MAG TPA: hypothetical protein DCW90_11345 [Lachnospiraceae bacterium]|nr:hypothetical protein [Lachnospiraceae bacterium]